MLGEGSMSLEHLVSKDSLKSKVKFNMDDGMYYALLHCIVFK